MMHRVNLISIFVIALLFQWTNSSDFFNQHFKSNLSKDDEYYKILGISKTATDRDVKAAYRKKAMQIHPDKGGNEEDFKRLVEAYEVLSDQNKRKLYDTFGKVGIKGQHNPDFASASSMNPDFRDFFRSFSNFPVVYNIEIDLEDFFRGRSLSVVIQNEKFSIDIEPGMYDGTEIRGQIIDRSGTTRQIVLILQEKSHPYFRRKNGDLYMECTISLAEVMLGFERVITHLDGSQFTIRSKEGDLVAPDEVLMIEGLGMPLYRSDTRAAKGKVLERGRLFVKVKVDIPSRLSFTAEERQLLQKIFSSKQGQRVPKNPSSVDPPRKIPPIPVFTPQKSDLRKFGGVGSFYDEENADNDFNGFSSFFFR